MSVTEMSPGVVPVCLIGCQTPMRLMLIGAVFDASAVLTAGRPGGQTGLMPAAIFRGFVTFQILLDAQYPASRQVWQVLRPFVLWAVLPGRHVRHAKCCAPSQDALFVIDACCSGLTGYILAAVLAGPAIRFVTFYFMPVLFVACLVRVEMAAPRGQSPNSSLSQDIQGSLMLGSCDNGNR